MNIGGAEILVIFMIILIVFGPRRIPEAARFLARIVKEFRKAIEELKREISDNDDFSG